MAILGVSERCDAVSDRARGSTGLMVCDVAVLGGLPGLFVSTQVILFSVLLGHAMRVRRASFSNLGLPLVGGSRNAIRRYSEWTYTLDPCGSS